MPSINVTTRDGSARTLDGESGKSLMQNLRDGGIDEILALCGGCASCATCHVYVDEAWLAKLPTMSADEDDLLDCSDARQDNSRLSCQIPLTPELEGISVIVAPQD